MWSSILAGAAFGCAVVSYIFLLKYIRKTERLSYELHRFYDILFEANPEVPIKKESDKYRYCITDCGGTCSFSACPHSEDPEVREHDVGDRRSQDR